MFSLTVRTSSQSHTQPSVMGVDHRGTGRQVPPPQILSCCKILSTRLLALQCRKCVFCLYSRTFIVSPAMRPPRIPVRSTPVPSVFYIQCIKDQKFHKIDSDSWTYQWEVTVTGRRRHVATSRKQSFHQWLCNAASAAAAAGLLVRPTDKAP